MEKWVIHFAIAFALRQVAKFHDKTDWAQVKVDLDVRIAGALPGDWLDGEAILAANWVLDSFAAALAEKEDLQKLVEMIVAGDWEGALGAAKALLIAASDHAPASFTDAVTAA